MKFKKNLALIFLASSGLVYTTSLAKAEIETTTVKTTTYSNEGVVPTSTTTTETRTVAPEGRSIVLPATATYVVIDPLTGAERGVFDPLRGAVDVKTVLPGSIIVDKFSGKVLAVVSPSGQTIDVVSAPAVDSLVVAIDSRRAEIDRMITSALSEGTIDTTQAAALRAELDKIATRESLAKQSVGVLTYSEALSLALALNNLSDRTVLIGRRTVTVTPLLGSKIVSNNGTIVMVDDMTYRRLQLTQRVDDEYTAGRLSARQVSDLKEQLNLVASLDSKYRKNGQLSSSKAQRLAIKLDIVQSRLTRDVALINDKRAKIGIRVQ